MTSKKSPGGVIAGRTADGRHRVLYSKDVGKDVAKARSKYQPHQGAREQQRRLLQAAKRTGEGVSK